MSVNLSYVTQAERIARNETLKGGQWSTTMKLEVRRSLCERNGRRAEKKTARYRKGKNTMIWKRQGGIFEMGK
jgi:hypothetical protein